MWRFISLIAFAALLLPLAAEAFPFGGQASIVVPCYNQAIYANLGAPRGGPYVWTESTKTYQYGPPVKAGQWLLGLASAPYYCIVSISPVIVWPGTAISMMGSSGSSNGSIVMTSGGAMFATSPNRGDISNLLSSGANQNGNSPSTETGSGVTHVLISEVFYNVDPAHGVAPQNQWIEIYNPTGSRVDLSGWKLVNAGSSVTLPSGTSVSSGGYIVLTGDASTVNRWDTTSDKFVSLGTWFSGGLSNTSDDVRLKNASGTAADAVSWGGDTNGFSPSAPAVPAGHSLIRKTLASDSDTASDWVDTSTPTPGY